MKLLGWLPDKPNTGQSWAYQQPWWCLCDNIMKKGWKVERSSCEREEWGKKRERKNSADTQVSEGKTGSTPGARAEIPCNQWGSTFPSCSTEHPHCSPWAPPCPGRWRCLEDAVWGEPMQKEAPGRGYTPWRGAHAGAGFLARPVTLWVSTLEQSIPEDLQPLWKDHMGTVHEELSPLGKTLLWSGKQCEKEGAVKARCCELTTNTIPHFCLHSPFSVPPQGIERWNERVRSKGINLSLGRSVCKMTLVSSLFLTILLYFNWQ